MKISNIVLGAAFMTAMALVSSCQKADDINVSTSEMQTKQNENSKFYVYDYDGEKYVKYETVYRDDKSTLYFNGSYAGAIKKACHDKGIRMSYIYAYDLSLKESILVSEDLDNYDEIINYDGLLFASVTAGVEESCKLPGVEFCYPFYDLAKEGWTSEVSGLPIFNFFEVQTTSVDQYEKLKTMVNDYGCVISSAPDNEVGTYVVTCEKNTKDNPLIIANNFIESQAFGHVNNFVFPILPADVDPYRIYLK